MSNLRQVHCYEYTLIERDREREREREKEMAGERERREKEGVRKRERGERERGEYRRGERERQETIIKLFIKGKVYPTCLSHKRNKKQKTEHSNNAKANTQDKLNTTQQSLAMTTEPDNTGKAQQHAPKKEQY